MSIGQRVLVTGASGFIGFHCLAPLVKAGYDVIAVGRSRTPAAPAGVKWLKADLLAPGEPRRVIEDVKPSQLLHLAWYVEPGKMINHADNLAWVTASISLLEEFRKHGGSRVVASGSCYEYDWRYGYCSEELTPLTADTVYGHAKNSFSAALAGFCQSTGLSGAWGRLFFLYGPYENPRRLVPSVILSLLRGQEAPSSHGEQIRDYAHVQDVANGLVALLASERTGAYNIATGRAVTIRTIVERIGALTERANLLRIGALPARANDAPLVVASMVRTSRDLGWQSAIDFDAGLRSTIDWWRAELAREAR
jgi:nucleoside-diphosphate-sugar epimerase